MRTHGLNNIVGVPHRAYRAICIVYVIDVLVYMYVYNVYGIIVELGLSKYKRSEKIHIINCLMSQAYHNKFQCKIKSKYYRIMHAMTE